MKSFKDWLIEAIMDPKTALKIFGLSEFPKTATELRNLHKKLALTNHPDCGGSLEKMKDINAANDVLKQWIGKSVKSIARSGTRTSASQTYRQAGETFKTSRARANANRDEFEKDILKTHGPIYRAIAAFLEKLPTFAFATYISEVLGIKFTHTITKVSTVEEIVKMKDHAKEPWIRYVFTDKSGMEVFGIELTGDTDHMAWRMRNTSNGFENSKNFDFEWAIAVDFYKGRASNKKVVLRKKKYRSADLSILKDPKKLLSPSKIKTAYYGIPMK